MSVRDIKRTARRDLHAAMRVPALYVLGGADPLLVGVRVHTKFKAAALGVGGGWADSQESAPKLIFHLSEVAPKQGAFVSVEPGEAYVLGAVSPPDGEFATVQVAAMSATQIVKQWPDGQPLPGA